MFLRNIRAVMRREKECLRGRPWERLSMFWLPLLWMAVGWGIFSSGLMTHLPVVLVDEDGSGGSREIARMLDATRGVKVVEKYGNLEAGLDAVVRGESYGVIYIPRNWERDLMRGDGASVVLYANMMFTTVGGTVAGEGGRAAGEVLGGMMKRKLSATGGGMKAAEKVAELVRVEGVPLFNPNLSYEHYLGGSLLPGVLQFILVIGVICAIGREFSKKTVKSWLDAAGGDVAAAVVGKLLPVFLWNGLLAVMLVAWFAGWRGFAASGSLLAWLAALWLLLLSVGGVAVLLFGVARNTERAISLAGFYSAPMLAFSGFSMPVEAMSPFGKIWAFCLPLTHYLPVQNMEWNAGAPVGDALSGLATLAVFFAVAATGGWLLIRRAILAEARREEELPS